MKVVTVLSGGMDSVTLAYWLKAGGHHVAAISFDYHQKHAKELAFARLTCSDLGLEHYVFDLRPYQDIALSALTNKHIEVPDGHYAEESMKATVVPNRNMTMMSIAAAWAISSNAQGIAVGVHAGDHAVYPDCRPEFIVHMETTLKVANEGFIDPSFQILAPWISLSKNDIAKIGNTLGVPWERTWSCYKGGELHCGKCGTCVERKEALDSQHFDPTEYAA